MVGIVAIPPSVIYPITLLLLVATIVSSDAYQMVHAILLATVINVFAAAATGHNVTYTLSVLSLLVLGCAWFVLRPPDESEGSVSDSEYGDISVA